MNAQIQDALAKGAVNSTPSNPTFTNPPAEGNYVIPTVLTNVTHDMTVMREETFGPVIPIMKVSSDEEAVKWMNDSDYGLTASVWTQDMDGGERLLKQLEAGTVFINRCDYPSPVSIMITFLAMKCAYGFFRILRGLGGKTRVWDVLWVLVGSMHSTSLKATISGRSKARRGE